MSKPKQAKYRIIKRTGWYIPQERFLWFFWITLPELPYPCLGAYFHSPKMFTKAAATDFIQETIEYRETRKKHSREDQPKETFYFDSEGNSIS